jgi:tetratricopeptide (TPR) repeat protein
MAMRARWKLAGPALSLLILQACAGGDGLMANTGATQSAFVAGPYTPSETLDFFAAAGKAERIAGALQRCLDYPDPPGSHWSRDAVEAYCRYQLTSGLPFEELKALVQAGRGPEVDRRMAELLQGQLARRGPPDLFDATYELDFDRSSSAIRHIIDAWRRQSPESAFAYAASGVAYTRAAWDARGSAWAQDTPQSNFETMQRLSMQAASDLGRAVALDGRMTTTYATMIRLAGLNGDAEYASAAAKRGLAIEPSNYLIRSRLIWLAQPKWGGSVEEMRTQAAAAQPQIKNNPLLVLIGKQPDARAAGFDDCGCGRSPVPASEYRRIFDQVITKSWLGGAGLSAANANQHALGAMYLSEALRFNPDNTDYLIARSNAFTRMGQYAWALADADRALEADPAAKRAWTARGYAYRSAGDFAHAERDYRAALNLKPGDRWTLDELGRIYVYSTHEFDKGWDIANQMIQDYPEDPDGWILRASIQKDQPRPGLRDTITYFIDHFGSDPSQQAVVAQMRPSLTQGPTNH